MENHPPAQRVALIQPRMQAQKSTDTKSDSSNTNTNNSNPSFSPSHLVVPVAKRLPSPLSPQAQTVHTKRCPQPENLQVPGNPSSKRPTSPCTLQVQVPLTKRPLSPGSLQATSAFHSPQAKFLAAQCKDKFPIISSSIRRSSSPNALLLQVPSTAKSTSRRGSATSPSPSEAPAQSSTSGPSSASGPSSTSGPNSTSGPSSTSGPNSTSGLFKQTSSDAMVESQGEDVIEAQEESKPKPSNASKRELHAAIGIAVKSSAGRSGLSSLLGGGGGRKISWLKAYKSAKW